MSTHTDDRTLARVRSAVNDARSHLARCSSAIKAATSSPVGDVPMALESAEQSLEAAWEALAYITTEIGEA